ncbi:DJ-1/PfpI family protein [Pseudovibrio exalbescens]|uniref:DJ-1/PfpI family protein n=1 Tax=Pseudovibrio exalbescens TaxID=197461 RepID=UPI002365144B|nr:DJ-1/PfpI family protein [Pseudovibrio exalbescens]MDD7911167.1 DJ-1/PfpI family protein [Pseudovibrio exalbescens]
MMAKVALILTEGFADWEYALIAGTGGPYYGAETRFFAHRAGEVTSLGGLKAMVPHGLDELAAWKPEVVVVVGGSIWETENAPDIADLLARCHKEGATIAGICGGTLALARAGLLNGVAHTSNALEFLQTHVTDYNGAENYKETPKAVSSDRIVTAAGTSPVTFAAEVLKSAGVPEAALGELQNWLAAEHA